MELKTILAALLLGVVGAFVLMNVVPVILMSLLTAKTSSMLDDVAGDMSENLKLWDGAAVGWDRRELRELEARLLDASALPGESTRNTRVVHVALVTVDAPKRGSRGSAGDPVAAFVPVTLDVTKLSAAAAVLVSDSPIRWNLVGTNPHQRGKLGFEGPAPVDVEPLPQGIIAGLRISGRHALRVADSVDLRRNRWDFWSGWPFLVLVSVLLGLEWFLRRRNGLL